jgi:biopolymer transport protein ExbD
MAGGGASEDNPVSLNVTAMVDIIFCLCLFFMCSFHFKQVQGKLDTWLPRDGPCCNVGPPADTLLEEIRVVLDHNAPSGGTLVRFGGRSLGVITADTRDALLADLLELVLESYADQARVGKRSADVPVIIDARTLVAWRDVVAVMNVCKDHGLERIEFAAPLPPGE